MANEGVNFLRVSSKFKYFVFCCLYYLLYPLCNLLYGKRNRWIICERGDDAQDNGFVFFEYLRKNHKEIKATYLIKKTASDYEKVLNMGECVQFGSFKHFLMAIGCNVKISTHLFGYAPWVQMELFFRRNKTKKIHVFLQHGIIKNYHEGLIGSVCKSLNIFICGAKPEFDFIKSEFKYESNVPQYTGLARYDKLIDESNNNQILVMPTWRSKLFSLSEEDFAKTDYYIRWSSLLKNITLLNELEKTNSFILLYLHYEMQRFAHLFPASKNVRIAKYQDETVQNLLKKSKLLITDFSSVFFDFAYMKKSMIYYQFDEDTYYDEHYTRGYFDYRKNGFGPVYLYETQVVDSAIMYIRNSFAVESLYRNRADENFLFRDTNNCNRIYNSIMDLLKNE